MLPEGTAQEVQSGDACLAFASICSSIFWPLYASPPLIRGGAICRLNLTPYSPTFWMRRYARLWGLVLERVGVYLITSNMRVKRPKIDKRGRLVTDKQICRFESLEFTESVCRCSLPGQVENNPTIAVQLECDGRIDGTNRRFVLLTLQRNEVKGSLRIPIILSHPSVVLVCQLD
jgi:hypothetical protein